MHFFLHDVDFWKSQTHTTPFGVDPKRTLPLLALKANTYYPFWPPQQLIVLLWPFVTLFIRVRVRALSQTLKSRRIISQSLKRSSGANIQFPKGNEAPSGLTKVTANLEASSHHPCGHIVSLITMQSQCSVASCSDPHSHDY